MILTEEIWDYRKRDRDNSKARITPTGTISKSPAGLATFDEILEKFFCQTFGVAKIRMEWAYGFYEGLHQHKDFVALDEIRKIIDNEMDELCHWHQEQWLEKVKERLIVASENEDENVEILAANFIKKDVLEATLSTITGQRFETRLKDLVERALAVCSQVHNERNGEIKPKDPQLDEQTVEQVEFVEEKGNLEKNVVGKIGELFQITPGEDYNPFIRGLIELYQAIKQSYVEEILTELHKSVDHENQGKLVNAIQLAHAIESVSPTTAVTTERRSRSSRVSFTSNPISIDVSASIAWIMHSGFDSEKSADSIPMEILVSRIGGANLYPVAQNF